MLTLELRPYDPESDELRNGWDALSVEQATAEGKNLYVDQFGDIWTDGERYEGDFVNGQLTGKGVFFYKNGERYEGDFVNGCKEGYGTMYYPDGRYDTGRWHDDNFMG